ncbi:hypothetical protein M3Y99_01459300 [Aphelenchoides fujianensis]|nr:hypothetical protein M3Y99_01459300 [Aphelenchoides fujianensis]
MAAVSYRRLCEWPFAPSVLIRGQVQFPVRLLGQTDVAVDLRNERAVCEMVAELRERKGLIKLSKRKLKKLEKRELNVGKAVVCISLPKGRPFDEILLPLASTEWRVLEEAGGKNGQPVFFLVFSHRFEGKREVHVLVVDEKETVDMIDRTLRQMREMSELDFHSEQAEFVTSGEAARKQRAARMEIYGLVAEKEHEMTELAAARQAVVKRKAAVLLCALQIGGDAKHLVEEAVELVDDEISTLCDEFLKAVDAITDKFTDGVPHGVFASSPHPSDSDENRRLFSPASFDLL